MTKPMMRVGVLKLLAAAGYTLARSTGRHDVYRCADGQHTIPVPRHSEISAGVVASISKSLHLNRKDFP